MFQRCLLLSLSLILLSALEPASGLALARHSISGSTHGTVPGAVATGSLQLRPIREPRSLPLPVPYRYMLGQQTQQATEPKATEALPPLDQILDKYVQAIGGKAAVQAPTSRVMKGTISVPALGADGTVEIYAKAPNKELTEWASEALGSGRIGFNGTLAWQEEDGEVKDQPVFAKKDADFYLPIKLRELYPRIEFKGKEKLGNAEVYRLEAPRNGNPKRWYFDSKTGLLLRTEVRNPEGKLLRSEDYEDYRVVDGIKIAFTRREAHQEGLEIVIEFSQVKHNVPLDDARFEKPGSK
jgi:hypothetical protein